MDRIRQLAPLFWIGLLPVVMLLWLWADSLRHQFYWTCGSWELQHRFLANDSVIKIYRVTGVVKTTSMTAPNAAQIRAGFGYNFGPFRRSDTGYRSTATWFPAPMVAAERQQRAEKIGVEYATRLWVVPFWLVLAGYVPLWLLLAWWQARRRRKKIERELAVTVDEA